jgi:hypothetical protein
MRNAIALGMTVGLTAGFCTAASAISSYFPNLLEFRRYFVAGWLLLAVLLFVVGFKRNAASAGKDGAADEGAFLSNPRFWALVAAIYGGLSLLITPWYSLKARAATVGSNKPEPKNSPVIVTNETRVVWPALRLQGITVNSTRSSAIINGKTYLLGERMDNGALITAITPACVTLEHQSETMELRFSLH